MTTRLKNSSPSALLATLVAAGFLWTAGCRQASDPPPESPSIDQIFVVPNPVPVGSNAAVTLSLRNVGNRHNEAIYYSWKASPGEFSAPLTREPKSTFIAKERHGL